MSSKEVREYVLVRAQTDAENFVRSHSYPEALRPPVYDPSTYVSDISHNPYTDGLIILRHYVKLISDIHLSFAVGAKNVDLFMLTPSISSPMAPGSDSEAIPIMFGDLKTFLVDSSQFGFEPLLLQGLERVYCYLPSMRGEEPDKRHLNQFFHCEMEMVGTLQDLRPIIEDYVCALAEIMLALSPLTHSMSTDPHVTDQAWRKLAVTDSFESFSFDTVFRELAQLPEAEKFIVTTPQGRDITAEGECYFAKKYGDNLPVWIEQYDRDRVAFYQKPHPDYPNTVINADLVFPALFKDSFGGEIVGSGQRQNLPDEMLESLERQGLDADPYRWYVDLRRDNTYQITSGFGLGIERFIAWALGYANIRDVILYPRLKNIKTLP